ncbi:hypothetical protein ACIGEP_16355 [Microbacterium sp. NPDC077663]|uniref:hypothetical protein n=1 Tax=Microbacterium sp. NPDC077663 TaxID=3364189 RepID=UPI0037CAC6C4
MPDAPPVEDQPTPRYAHPTGADDIADAVTAFGSPAKVAIIRHLRVHPGGEPSQLGGAESFEGVARERVLPRVRR